MSKWIPEIVYEDDDSGQTSKIPLIMVPDGEEMPKVLFMFESRNTGEFEPGSEGEDLPVVQWDLHQYANMNVLKEKLDENTFDKVRAALGLEAVKSAATKGRAITDNIRSKIA